MLSFRLWSWFVAVDTDRSGHISAHELGTSCSLSAGGDAWPFKLMMTVDVCFVLQRRRLSMETGRVS